MLFLFVLLLVDVLFGTCTGGELNGVATANESASQAELMVAQKYNSAGSVTVTPNENQASLTSTTKSTSQATPSLAKILSDRTLWGKDFPLVLGFLDSWSQSNEKKIYIFTDRVVGSNRYKTREEAQQAAARMREAIKATRPRPRPEFLDLLKGLPSEAPEQLSVEVIRFLPDDDDFHVAWKSPSLGFLAQNLSVATVRERLGPPEKTTLELIQNETERRPVVLTMHSYAGGAVIFAESDWATPGYVDRAILDVPTIRAALY